MNPTGIHRTRFTLPGHWRGRRVILHFGGVESYFEATHINQLPRHAETVVHLDSKHSGVGTSGREDASEQAYLVHPGVYALKYRMKAF